MPDDYPDPNSHHPVESLEPVDAVEPRVRVQALATFVPTLVGFLNRTGTPEVRAARLMLFSLALGIPAPRGERSRGEIAATCGLSRQTTTRLSDEITAEFGLVVPGQRGDTNRARCRANRYASLRP